jgi:hypothetical protein
VGGSVVAAACDPVWNNVRIVPDFIQADYLKSVNETG